MDHIPAESRTPSVATRIVLIVAGLAIVFGAILAVEVFTGPKEAVTLPRAPSSLIPATFEPYVTKAEPDLAASLRSRLELDGVAVRSVEAAAIQGRQHVIATVFGARLRSETAAASRAFRSGVLAGAAAGFEIDLQTSPFVLRRAAVDVYATTAAEGQRLVVWFFRDAFCQLFVDAENASEAERITDRLIAAQVSASGASPG